MQRPTRLAVAMHEAGHAVAQLSDRPGPWIDYVAIDGLPDDKLGLVHSEDLWDPDYMECCRASDDILEQWRRLAWRDVVAYLAGPIAELRWRRCSRPAIWLGARQMSERCLGDPEPEHNSDFGRVRRRLRWAYAGAEQAHFVTAWLEAEHLVSEWWPEIMALGRQIASRGRLVDVELLAAWVELERERRTRRSGRKEQP